MKSKNILGVDLGSVQTTAIIAHKEEDASIKIIGYGISKTQGVKRGAITNIEPAAKTIIEAVEKAKLMSGESFDETIISISGSHAISVDSVGVVSIPNKHIGEKEIYRAIAAAENSARASGNTPLDYEIIHVLPYSFKVDNENVDDPLTMEGERLEVATHIVLVKKLHVNNIKTAAKVAGLEVNNIVVSGYASSIACIDECEKEPGAVIIDMGGAVCDMVVHLGNSLRHNACFPIGSQNITNDLVYMLKTTPKAAEELKLKFALLDPKEIVTTPIVGDDNRLRETPYAHVVDTIYSRVSETFIYLARMLEESGYYKRIGSSVVLTGGFTKVANLLELANTHFPNHSVRLATAKNHKTDGGHNELFDDPQKSCAIGLCLYGAGLFTPYEFDSNSKMRYAGEKEEDEERVEAKRELEELFEESDDSLSYEDTQVDYEDLVGHEEKKPGVIKKFIDKLTNQF